MGDQGAFGGYSKGKGNGKRMRVGAVRGAASTGKGEGKAFETKEAERTYWLEAAKNGQLQWASAKERRADPEIVLEAVRSSERGTAFRFADAALRADRDFVLRAMEGCGREALLQYADEALKRDKDFVMQAITQCCGDALTYADDALRRDKEFVKEAVRQKAFALRCAARSMQADREIVLEALKASLDALDHADPVLFGDRGFMFEAVQQEGLALMYASDDLKADSALVLAAVKSNGHALSHAKGGLQANREIVLEAVRESANAIRCAADACRADRVVVLAALRQQRQQFRSLPGILSHLRRCRDDPKSRGKGWRGYTVLVHVPWSFRDDPGFMLAAAREYGLAIADASERITRDRNLVFEAVRRDGEALEFAHKELQSDPELQPQRVAQNHVAGKGLEAPTFMVAAAARMPGGGLEITMARMSGETAIFKFEDDDTFGNLASAVATHFKVEGGLVHLLAAGEVVPPLDISRPLSAMAMADVGDKKTCAAGGDEEGAATTGEELARQ
uniref:DUF4116 domain-containing protein n=1 Tax=Zooxanthella nutricula TaxID=1333877 RepID=A0A7S2VLI5_9DINO